MVKLANGSLVDVVRLRSLFVIRVAPLAIVRVPVDPKPPSGRRSWPVMSKVPLDRIMLLAFTFTNDVPVAPVFKATSNRKLVVEAPQFVPNNDRLSPTN